MVIAGPSGVGKTSIVAGLQARRPSIVLPVSVTTRPARPGEVDGVHYRFVDDPTFDSLVERGAFLEWARVHGRRYGTPKDEVDDALAAGETVVLEIDVQGAHSVRQARPDALLIFIEPPDEATLAARLSRRGTESDETARVRLANAIEELAAAPAFDHRVVNETLDEAVDLVIRILDATSSGTD